MLRRWLVLVLVLGLLRKLWRVVCEGGSRGDVGLREEAITVDLRHETRVHELERQLVHLSQRATYAHRLSFLVPRVCEASLRRHRRRVAAGWPVSGYVLRADTELRVSQGWDVACAAQAHACGPRAVLSTLPKAAPSVTFTCLLTGSYRVGSRYADHAPQEEEVPNLLASGAFLFGASETIALVPTARSDMLLSAHLHDAGVRVMVPRAALSRVADTVAPDAWYEHAQEPVRRLLNALGVTRARAHVDTVLGVTAEATVEEMLVKYGSVDAVVERTRAVRCEPVADIGLSDVPVARELGRPAKKSM